MLDASGSLWEMDKKSLNFTKLLDIHAGRINAIDASPRDHFAASAGADGTLRCWDYVDGSCIFSRTFECAATALTWAPPAFDAKGCTVTVGFANGVVSLSRLRGRGCQREREREREKLTRHHTTIQIRTLCRLSDRWHMVGITRPHKEAVTSIQYSRDGKLLCTTSEDKFVWFLENHKAETEFVSLGKAARIIAQVEELTYHLALQGDIEYTPLGFYLATDVVRSVDWRTDHVVVVAAGKSAIEIELPEDTGPLASLTAASYDITKELKATIFGYQRKPTLASAVASEPRLDPMGNPMEEEDDEVSFAPFWRSIFCVPPLLPALFLVSHALSPSLPLLLPLPLPLFLFDPLVDLFIYLSVAFIKSQEEEEEEAADVLAAIYKRTGLIDETFFLSLSDTDKGKLYECKHGNDYALNELASHAEDCRALRYSSSGKFLLSGCSDGTAHVRAAANPDHFVCVHLHDGNEGEVTSLCTSFDDEFLLTGDSSGCIFVSRLRPIEIEAHAAEAATSNSAMVKGARGIVMSVEKVGPTCLLITCRQGGLIVPVTHAILHCTHCTALALPCTTPQAQEKAAFAKVASSYVKADGDKASFQIERVDLFAEDPESYSIQDTKLKTEEDHEARAAEIKKQSVREAVEMLRKKFAELKRQNREAPASEQLDVDEFNIDPELRVALLEKGEQMVEEVRKE